MGPADTSCTLHPKNKSHIMRVQSSDVLANAEMVTHVKKCYSIDFSNEEDTKGLKENIRKEGYSKCKNYH